MSKSRNEKLLTPKPTASKLLLGEGQRGAQERRARRDAVANRIYKNRRLVLGAIGVAMVAGGAAGSARLLAQDTDQAAQGIFNNRVEAVSGAFSDPNPGVVAGEPSNADAARQVQVNEAHNAAVAANKAAQEDAVSK